MAINFYRAGESPPVEHLVVLIYGEPRIGKSTLALTASNPLLLNFSPEPTATSSESTMHVRKWDDASIDIVKVRSAQFDSVIVDSLRDAQRVLIRRLISDNPELQHDGRLTLDGYGALLFRFMGWISDLKALDKDIVLVVDSRTRERHHAGSPPPAEYEIDLLGSSSDRVPNETDMIGRIYFKMNGQRMLTFDGSARAIDKNPHGALKTEALPTIDEINGYLASLIRQMKDALNRPKVKSQANAA